MRRRRRRKFEPRKNWEAPARERQNKEVERGEERQEKQENRKIEVSGYAGREKERWKFSFEEKDGGAMNTRLEVLRVLPVKGIFLVTRL